MNHSREGFIRGFATLKAKGCYGVNFIVAGGTGVVVMMTSNATSGDKFGVTNTLGFSGWQLRDSGPGLSRYKDKTVIIASYLYNDN